jgi:hypothetical protein
MSSMIEGYAAGKVSVVVTASKDVVLLSKVTRRGDVFPDAASGLVTVRKVGAGRPGGEVLGREDAEKQHQQDARDPCPPLHRLPFHATLRFFLRCPSDRRRRRKR